MTENQKQFSTSLAKINDAYFPMIESQLTGNGIDMDDYSKRCVLNAISSINNALEERGVDWKNPQLDQSNITQILLNVASLKLNSAASPNEVYFQVRNVRTGKKDNQGNDIWKKQIEMGIEGDGNDAILSRFGRGVETVHQFWVVRENDDFEYPSYVGLEMTPPKWTPKGTGKVIRVVYPIERSTGTIEYHIAEREDVVKNLIAHVKNNLMNETFGIAESRYKANAKQRSEIQQKKNEIIESIKEKGLDGALNDKAIQKYISPAWKDEQSKESMILRKMRNNIVKRIPKDFGVSLRELSYEESSNDSEGRARKDVTEHANSEELDFIDFEEVESQKESTNPEENQVVEEKNNPDPEESKIDAAPEKTKQDKSQVEAPF